MNDNLPSPAAEFEFFQAVRWLEWLAHTAEQGGAPPRAPVGEDARPGDEVVRFRVPATAAFPSAALGALRSPPGDAAAGQPPELNVAFLGLIGPSGVLPEHYNAEAMARGQDQDHALREFFDVFQHRAISLFYRAWRKYRLPAEVERHLWRGDQDRAESEEPIAFALRCLIGLGTSGLAERLTPADGTFVYYSGHYSRGSRSAIALEQLVADYFQLPAQIEQFLGRWITVPPDQRTALPSRLNKRGTYCQLNRDATIGPRVWKVQTRFRVRLGPMGLARFNEFLPGGRDYRHLTDMVRLYVGPELEFDIQPVLRKQEVPVARLQAPGAPRSMLNRNGWLASRPRQKDSEDARFLARRNGSAV